MSEQQTQQDDRLAHVPEALKDRVRRDVRLEDVLIWVPYDLDRGGMYVSGYLALASGRLGEFVQRDGQWDGSWLEIAPVKKVELLEGLGLGMLRLHGEEAVVGEWRFSRRHEKEFAELRHHLELLTSGKEPDAPDGKGPKPHEKKLRCEKCGGVIPAWSEVCPACMSRRKILFRLMDFVKPYKFRAICGALVALSMTALALVGPWLTRPMLDRGLGGEEGYDPNWPLFATYACILVGVILVMAVGRAVQERLMAGLGCRVARTIRDATYQHLHKLSLSFFATRQTGSLVTRVTSDSDRLWDFIAFTAVQAGVAFLTIAGVGVLLFVLNWKLAIFVLLPVPVMGGMMAFFHKRMHRVFHRIFHRWGQMTAVVADALPGVRVIKAFSQERREIDRFGAKNEQVFDEEVNLISTWTTFGPVMMLCSSVGTVIVWLLGGWWVIQDFYNPPAGDAARMTVGTLMSFLMFMGMFNRPVHMIAHMDRMFNRAATSAQRIFDILDAPPRVFSKTEAVRASDMRGEIELRDVTFSYDGVRRVLKNINVKIAPGEMIGLAGPSGGGKTTLVNLICRFYDVQEGAIFIDGVDVRDYDVQDLRRHIGVVLQEPFLFHGTVAENISYGNADANLDTIIASAKTANAHDFIVGFPDGYDTLVGERGQSLSGGERQRISIARAILHNPKILILDEATSSVDTEAEKLIQDAVARLVANRTTIAIAHRLSTLRQANRLVILDKGNLIEQGTHEELAAKEDGVYAKLLKMQTETHSYMAVSG